MSPKEEESVTQWIEETNIPMALISYTSRSFPPYFYGLIAMLGTLGVVQLFIRREESPRRHTLRIAGGIACLILAVCALADTFIST